MRRKLLLIVVLCGIFMTGCVKAVSIDEQESNILAEYMAETVLRYSDDYDAALVYPETLESDTESLSKDDKESNMQVLSPVKSSDQKTYSDYTSMYEDMGYGNFNITYSSYSVSDIYTDDPDNKYFSLVASKGKQLLIISFDIKNDSKKDKQINLIGSDIEYQLKMNNNVYTPMMTLLNNDIQFISHSIAAGETKNAVIVFEISKEQEIADMNLIVSNNDFTTTINIK